MNADAVLVPLGILCLAVPTSAVTTSEMRDRLERPARRRYEGVGPLARSKLNWVDFIRGAAGTWLLQRAFPIDLPGQDDLVLIHYAAVFAILLLGVLTQTVWLHRPVRIIGPLFFLCGMSLVLCGPLVAAFAIVLGLTCALLLCRLSLAFVFVPIGILGFGQLLKHTSLFGFFDAFAFGVPAFLAFALGQRLAFVRRRVDHPIEVSVPESASLAEPIKLAEPVKVEPAAVIRPDFNSAKVKIKAAKRGAKVVGYVREPELKPAAMR